MRVYVLLLNAETEGIHTVKLGDTNTILMFEQEDDATRYAMMLEAQDFPKLLVEAIEDEEIIEFCRNTGMAYKLVTQKDLVVPPENNIEQENWDLDRTSDVTTERVSDTTEDSDTDLDSRAISDSDLENLRKQFENLL